MLVLHFYKLSIDLISLIRGEGVQSHATGSVGHICSVVNQLQA